jgi:hypothetical protein
MIDLQSITSLGPIPLLVAACNLIGLAVKKSPIGDRWIPVLLPIVGAVCYPFITGEADANVRHPMLFNALLGAVIGGSSVGVNQMFRQFLGGNGKENDTQHHEKPNPPVPPASPAAGQ